ncbi:FAD-dependent oxidoreductase [Labrys sp. LIt4]|uniref:NAD(P)/FAD-dependent oxidoreductase n=1 Tax=Labrys sp. LIt4 TaxID=2821355 RepID=UPI001ADF849B|nr:FAD-dependent oxidoreductase [Labrys sp. LIt4]MBP0579522.1 FAD-dependent oxidoreductase [Labrys sp. LIt4]
MSAAERMAPDVLVVGGGPAGLSAATTLRELGVGRVVLLERDTVVGGIPRHCGHSPFGMREFRRILSGTRYAARLEARAKDRGVEILTRHSVLSVQDGAVKAVSPDGSVEFRPRRILLATGTREASRAARLVSGERPLGILNTAALQAYVHLEKLAPFRRPVIVGTELVAMSAILTCLSGGIRPAAMIEPNARPTARFPFGLLPRLLGIPVHYRSEIGTISGKGRVQEVVVRSEAGDRSIGCDGVLFTGAFTPESALARLAGLPIDAGSGGPVVDAFGRTRDGAIFAAGNLLRPVETAGWCWAEARRIAGSIAHDLENGLPARQATIPLRIGAGIKLILPQEIDRGGIGHADLPRALPELQLRLSERLRGTLTLSAGGAVLWSRAIASGPERRILIPTARLAIPPAAAELTLQVVQSKAP